MEAFREAEEYCALGMVRTPGAPELPWLAGWCCFQRGELDQSIAWSKIAIAVASEKNDLVMSFRHVPAWYEAPYDVLRYAFRNQGNLLEADEAEQLFTKAMSNRIAYQESRILDSSR